MKTARRMGYKLDDNFVREIFWSGIRIEGNALYIDECGDGPKNVVQYLSRVMWLGG